MSEKCSSVSFERYLCDRSGDKCYIAEDAVRLAMIGIAMTALFIHFNARYIQPTTNVAWHRGNWTAAA